MTRDIRPPSEGRIRRAALKNAAVAAYIAKPLGECPELCTERAILDGLPVVMVFEFGYASCSLYDFENGNHASGMGELVEVRPLEPGDEFHPVRSVLVYLSTLPKTSIGRAVAKPKRASKRAAAAELTEDESDNLARELGLQ